MFNISQIGKILKATNRLNIPTEFNSTLPLTITIKKQLNPIRYLIQLGNKEVEVKSYTKLDISTQYKAEINQVNNKIEIKNLSKLPTIFSKMPKNLNYTIADLLKDDVLKDNKHYKNFLLNHLANSTSKEEFIFLTQLLIAENQQIKHIFINENKKRALMQLKYKKNRLKFYGFFENLGAIKGEILLSDEIYLNLMVEFQNSFILIKNNIDDLKLKGIIINIKQKKIKPLFEISNNNLLNIKV
jgi:hypothetical protein